MKSLTMKKMFLSFAVIVGVLAVSCKKENEVKPQSSTPAIPKLINVVYKIESESANVEAKYMFPNADGKLELKSETINRTEHTVSFSYKTGNQFSVEAYNINPSRKTVSVQLYIDGKMVVEGTSYSASQKAIAAGNY
jgi:hypothetical protein